jgi:hypothetical protein
MARTTHGRGGHPMGLVVRLALAGLIVAVVATVAAFSVTG